MMKKAPVFIPRDGGFSLGEIATHLHVTVHRVRLIAERAGVRLRFVSIGKKLPRYGPVTPDEARAIIFAFHVKRGKRLT